MPRYISEESRAAMVAGGRKGGKAKVPKGYSMLPKERYKEISEKRKINNKKVSK